jgi:hypothetical protein
VFLQRLSHLRLPVATDFQDGGPRTERNFTTEETETTEQSTPAYLERDSWLRPLSIDPKFMAGLFSAISVISVVKHFFGSALAPR